MSAEPTFADAILPPTPERWRRGDVRRSERQVRDARGSIGDPFVVVGLLLRLHRDARINDDELKAGYRFRSDFDRAHLDRYGRRTWPVRGSTAHASHASSPLRFTLPANA
jgi:hypothetical protein